MVGKRSERPTENRMINIFTDQKLFLEKYDKEINLSNWVRAAIDSFLIPKQFPLDIKQDVEKLILVKLVDYDKKTSLKDIAIDIHRFLTSEGYVVTMMQVYDFLQRRSE